MIDRISPSRHGFAFKLRLPRILLGKLISYIFSLPHARQANSMYDEQRREPLVNSFGSISKLYVRLQTTLDLTFRRYCMHLSSRVHLSFSFIFQSTLNGAEKVLQVFFSHQSEFLFTRQGKLIDLPNICYRQPPHSS